MVAGAFRPVHPPSLASIEIAGGGLFYSRLRAGGSSFAPRKNDAGGNGAEA